MTAADDSRVAHQLGDRAAAVEERNQDGGDSKEEEDGTGSNGAGIGSVAGMGVRRN